MEWGTFVNIAICHQNSIKNIFSKIIKSVNIFLYTCLVGVIEKKVKWSNNLALYMSSLRVRYTFFFNHNSATYKI